MKKPRPASRGRQPRSETTGRARLARNLRRVRIARGLSQEELAENAGFHRTFVSQIERERNNVSIDNIERLAAALGVDLVDLLER